VSTAVQRRTLVANLNTGDTAFLLLSAALVEGGEHYRHSEDEAKARAREAKWQRSDAAYETHQRATIAKILASHARDSIFRGDAVSLEVEFPISTLVDQT
jgi:hypothetical protein